MNIKTHFRYFVLETLCILLNDYNLKQTKQRIAVKVWSSVNNELLTFNTLFCGNKSLNKRFLDDKKTNQLLCITKRLSINIYIFIIGIAIVIFVNYLDVLILCQRRSHHHRLVIKCPWETMIARHPLNRRLQH